ncbi:MAG: glycosyltransferase family 4 protein [Sphingomonas sp.]
MKENKALKIVVLGAQPEWLSGMRGPMIREFLARGHDVTAIGAEEIEHVRTVLEGWGARYVVVPIRRAGLNPVADLGAIFSLYRALRRLKPDLVFAYTVKPIVYGLPVAWAAGVRRRFAMITGRGYAFQPGKELSRHIARILTVSLYKLSLKFADGILFHNNDDRDLFVSRRMIGRKTGTRRIWGSGIDLDHYQPQPVKRGPAVFLMIGRLIIDKGVREYVAAAEMLKRKYPEVRFRLVGPSDPSPNGITASEIQRWRDGGFVDYVGPLIDVRGEIADSHVVVLPSYAEGLPRSVLEGMATGRAIITTDAPGCADTVEEGVSGYRVPVRNVAALAEAMEKAILDPHFVASAGQAGLALARDRFDVRKVNAEIAEFLAIPDLRHSV